MRGCRRRSGSWRCRRTPRRRCGGSCRGRPASRRGRSRGPQECGRGEQLAERRRLERMPARTALLDVELVEDRLRLRIARAVRLPLYAQPLVDLVEAVVRIEDAAHDELRRDRAVPPVLLQPERDVVPTDPAITVELRPVS